MDLFLDQDNLLLALGIAVAFTLGWQTHITSWSVSIWKQSGRSIA